MPTRELYSSAQSYVPSARSLPILSVEIQNCHGCDLYLHATQAVFGEVETGTKTLRTKVTIMMIGEQPGDKEDLEGRPFVGPSGKLLAHCLEEAGIDRQKVYVINVVKVVKHFKWEPRGKLRIHKKPNMREIHACRPWLEAELEMVCPQLIVCLGAVAAHSFLGPKFRLTIAHGRLQEVKTFLLSSQQYILQRFSAPERAKTVTAIG